MADLKTKMTDENVTAFLHKIDDEKRREDCFTIVDLMREATGAEPKMWGAAIIGFGDSRYTLSDGSQNDWFVIGFSPRKANLTLYVGLGGDDFSPLLNKLGKHTTGKGCLYIKKLSDVDMPTLKAIIEQSVSHKTTPNE